MPRAKFDPNNPYNMFFAQKLGLFKVNYADYIFDLRFIYQDILDFFGDLLGIHETEVKRKLDIVQNANVEPTLKNRMYIVTDIDHIAMAAVNMDDAVFDNLAKHQLMFDDLLHGCVPDAVNTSYISKMYLFRGTTPVSQQFLSTWQLAEFMAIFHNENQVDFSGCRDEWYAKPRREAKNNH